MLRDPETHPATGRPGLRLVGKVSAARATQRHDDEQVADAFREAENARLQAEREADPTYWRDRWCALWRSENWTIDAIARHDARSVDEVRAAIDEALRIYHGGKGLTQVQAERDAARERARMALRRRPTPEATR